MCISLYCYMFSILVLDAVSTVKVLYTDYTDFSVTFTCTKIQTDGSCDKNHTFVDVMGREKFEQSSDVMDKLTKLVKWTCFEPGDLVQNYFNGNVSCIDRQVHN